MFCCVLWGFLFGLVLVFFYGKKDVRYKSLGKKYELGVGFLNWHVDENEFLF